MFWKMICCGILYEMKFFLLLPILIVCRRLLLLPSDVRGGCQVACVSKIYFGESCWWCFFVNIYFFINYSIINILRESTL